MKKFIAISVVLALVAGSVFAETTISGSIETKWTIVKGATDGDGYAHSGPVEMHSGAVQFAGANDENTFGAVFKFHDGTWTDRAFVWWQPIDQLRINLGKDGDGWFEQSNLARWGFHFMPRNISVENWNAGDFMYQNWDLWSIAFIIKPVNGLTVNVAVAPKESRLGLVSDDEERQNAFSNFYAQASYNLSGVGNFAATFRNEGIGSNPTFSFAYKDGGFVDGLSFDLGVSYVFEEDGNDLLRFGWGVHYSGGDWGIKHRAYFRPISEKKNAADVVTQKSGIQANWIDFMPWYQFEEIQVLCNIRLILNAPDADGAGKVGWHVNPYIRKRMGGGHDFRVGAMFQDHSGSGDVNWYLATSWLFAF